MNRHQLRFVRRLFSIETLDPRCLMAADGFAIATPIVDPSVADVNRWSAVMPVRSLEAPVSFNPAEFQPMPLPTPDDSGPKTGVGQFVTYDVASRQVFYSALPESMPDLERDVVEGSMETGEVVQPEIVGPEFFSNLSIVNSPSTFPYSANVKEFFTFPNGQMYVCSGTLIDSRHVLTAGHCVYSASEGGWATSMRIAPGYDQGATPFGDAMATNFYSWTGWTQSGSYDHDIAVVRLDRPVGALSDWYGYGFDNNPYFYTLNIFHNSSYPAASPYNGQSMYYRNGFFDYTDTNSLGLWFGNQVGIYNQSYGGQSGSGAYIVDGGSRYVYTVLSNGNAFATNFPRITSGKFYNIRDDIIATARPSTLDLIPLNVKIGPGAISAGQSLSDMTYVVHNYSTAAYSGPVHVRVYLSTDDTISADDQLIQSHTFTYGFSPMSTVTVTVSSPPTIPANLAAGNYWIGVMLDIADQNPGNNRTNGQDAARIQVTNNSLPGDFNNDGAYTCIDIDTLVQGIASGNHDPRLDLNGDGLVNLLDRDGWLNIAGSFNLGAGKTYLLGDANLNGVVDGSDFGLWNANKFTSGAGWCGADFSADGIVDGSDFGLWNANKFQLSDGNRGTNFMLAERSDRDDLYELGQKKRHIGRVNLVDLALASWNTPTTDQLSHR